QIGTRDHGGAAALRTRPDRRVVVSGLAMVIAWRTLVAAIMRHLARHHLCGVGQSRGGAGERKHCQRQGDQKGQYGPAEPHMSPINSPNFTPARPGAKSPPRKTPPPFLPNAPSKSLIRINLGQTRDSPRSTQGGSFASNRHYGSARRGSK